MALKNRRFIKEIRLDIENISPLHIGSDEGEILLDLENKLTSIPGTSLAGAFRSYLENIGYGNIENLFGNDNISKVFFYDSYAKLKERETRPNVRINPEYGVEENKFERDYIVQGHKFNVKIEVYADSEEEFKIFEAAIYTCIFALNNGDINLGSYKSSGAGLFKILKLRESNVNLTNKNDLFKYLKGENKFEEKAIGTLKNIAFDSNDVTFILEGNLKTPILIKGEGLMDADRPDGEHIKNINGDYIIPGSSLKGVLRAQGERILGYFNKSNFSKEIFGSEDKDKKIASKLKCFDSVISNSKEGVYHRIKLDKLTGGVRKSALFDDKVVLGKVKLESKIKGNDEEIIDIGTALIALVYRDIALGSLSLGGGNNVGRGRINGEKLKITKGKELIYSYDFKENIVEVDNMERYFKVLRGDN